MRAQLHKPAGALASARGAVDVTPDVAGWTYTGLRVLDLAPGERFRFDAEDVELAVLPLAGGELDVFVDGTLFHLDGRTSVFERVTDLAYVPVGSELAIVADHGAQIALPNARATVRYSAVRVAAEDVTVIVMGSGAATRQFNDFFTPDAIEADKLVGRELLAPGGNWSSYPPHKHDTASECEAVLEEIYYFRIGGPPGGFGFHTTYPSDGEIDETVRVADGDVFLVPRGYHGPSAAAPGYPMYALNVLAGPGQTRTMACCDDPTHHWAREALATGTPDPRVPMTSAAGVVRIDGVLP